MRNWFNSLEASRAGADLADVLAQQSALNDLSEAASSFNILDQVLKQASGNVRAIRWNFFKRAKLAHAFKWRLIEKGVARAVADEFTQSLVLHLSTPISPQSQRDKPPACIPELPSEADAKRLLVQGNECFKRGAYADAAALYRTVIEIDGDDTSALYNLGSALSKLGLLAEAEEYLRRVIASNPGHAEANCKLGIVLYGRGELHESEICLRRALKVRPKFWEAHIHYGITLQALGRVRDAKSHFAKVMKFMPRNAEAVFLMGHVARMEGHFAEAETRFRDALKINPHMPNALAALTGIRKMTGADTAWLEGAMDAANAALNPADEINLRFAIGKFFDDLEDYEQAFQSFRRANELLKAMADPYDRDAREFFVDDMIRVYTADVVARIHEGGAQSSKPVFVVGMPRSGTSLVEQIIASHPCARGAGELGFCDDSVQGPESRLRQAVLGSAEKQKPAESYLRALQARAGEADRIIDKAPVNSDYLGLIYSVFPNARIIYMRRDPIDTCLSCYFQYFSPAMNFCMDLADLAHYFLQHKRLMDHWRSVLPQGFILEVPYSGLVENLETWTKKMLEFIGLEWDEKCLGFHTTERPVATASAWQVRQRIYSTSVGRWRSYQKFVGPLRRLGE